MNRYLLVAAMLASMNTISVNAESEQDPVALLEEQAKKAKELQELDYQAHWLEQRAKVARAYKELQSAGGYVPEFDEMFNQKKPTAPLEDGISETPPPPPPPPGAQAAAGGIEADLTPGLRAIQGSRATFQTLSGLVSASAGETLPGGFRVVSVNMRQGVTLERGGQTYHPELVWQ